MSTEVATEPLYTWKCKCGKFTVKLKGEPLLYFNCHCHSCVAAMRHVLEKHPGGTSPDVNGGVAKALFYLKHIEFENEEDPSDKLGYVKVGEKGLNIRSYTKCCGTLMNTSGGDVFPCNFRAFNRNAIVKTSDGSAYKPPTEPLNMSCKDAFEPDKIPEPKVASVPMGVIGKFMVGMVKKKLSIGKHPTLEGKKVFYATGKEDDVEAVPITWEGEAAAAK